MNDLEEMDQSEVEALKKMVADFYGPFHRDVTLHGVYFHDEVAPTTVYVEPLNGFNVAVLLPKHQSELIGRVAHLAHELVHCLHPNGLPSRQATYFEEGLADHAKVSIAKTLFSDAFPEWDFTLLCGGPGKYLDAFNAIEELVQIEGLNEMREGVQKMRAETGLRFKDIGERELSHQFRNTPRSLISFLSRRFH